VKKERQYSQFRMKDEAEEEKEESIPSGPQFELKNEQKRLVAKA
jgi:hypothetical protein